MRFARICPRSFWSEGVVVVGFKACGLSRTIEFLTGSSQCSGMWGNYVQWAVADLALDFRGLDATRMKEVLTTAWGE